MARARPQPPEEEEETPQRWADNKVALAQILGVSRTTIYNWEELPGCPGARSNGQYSVQEWRDFAESMGAELAETPSDKRALENRRLAIQCRRMEWKFEVEQKEWTPNEVIGSDVRRLAAELIATLRHEFEVTLPKRCCAKTSDQIREICTESLDRIMTRIHNGAAAIEAQFPAPVPKVTINPPEIDTPLIEVGARVVMGKDHKWAGECGTYQGDFEMAFGMRPKVLLDNGTECFATHFQLCHL